MSEPTILPWIINLSTESQPICGFSLRRWLNWIPQIGAIRCPETISKNKHTSYIILPWQTIIWHLLLLLWGVNAACLPNCESSFPTVLGDTARVFWKTLMQALKTDQPTREQLCCRSVPWGKDAAHCVWTNKNCIQLAIKSCDSQWVIRCR